VDAPTNGASGFRFRLQVDISELTLAEDEAVSNLFDKVIPEPPKKPPFDAEAWFARLDELGGRDFLPHGVSDDAPAEPDPRVYFDE
jgi:hypothetical protein